MRRFTLAAKAATTVTTLGTALAGLAVLTASPAQAALEETSYTFQTSNFGTRVTAPDVNLRSDRTAWAVLGCTRLAGKYEKISQASLDTSQTGNPFIDVGVVRSTKTTYTDKANGVRAGVLGTNNIAQVVLGDAGLGTPVLTIDGLRSTARSWVDTSGKFHAETGLRLASIELAGVDTSGATEALNDLLGAIQSQVLDQILDVLGANPDGIEIPGLGRIYLPGDSAAFRKEIVKPHSAAASVKALRIVLYGTDGVEGTEDDSEVVIGRAWSRIATSPAGVFRGHAYGLSAEVADGLIGVGRVAYQPLPCRGTNGNVNEAHTALLNLLGLDYVTTGDVSGFTMGKQNPDGSANAWAKGRVAGIQLTDGGSNSLTIDAVVGRVHVQQQANGQLVAASPELKALGVKFGDIDGTRVLGVYVNGEDQGDFIPGDTIEIPGLARIVFGEVSALARGLQVIGAHVYILPGAISDAGLVDVKLGVAKVRIKKY